MSRPAGSMKTGISPPPRSTEQPFVRTYGRRTGIMWPVATPVDSPDRIDDEYRPRQPELSLIQWTVDDTVR